MQSTRSFRLEERCEIARLSSRGQIAPANRGSSGSLAIDDLSRAEAQWRRAGRLQGQPTPSSRRKARRWHGSRLERDPELAQPPCLSGLRRGWSPEQVAGRLGREQGRKVISYESIYRFIYAQITRSKDYRWRHYLPRGKFKRGFRGTQWRQSRISFIEGRISLAETTGRSRRAHDPRPLGSRPDALRQIRPGRSSPLHERHSRIAVGFKAGQQSRKAHRSPSPALCSQPCR